MELWQAGIDVLVGFIVTGVTELLKKWTAINLPIVKFVAVLTISAPFGILLGWIYGVDMTAAELAQQTMIVALGAIGLKAWSKPGS